MSMYNCNHIDNYDYNYIDNYDYIDNHNYIGRQHRGCLQSKWMRSQNYLAFVDY